MCFHIRYNHKIPLNIHLCLLILSSIINVKTFTLHSAVQKDHYLKGNTPKLQQTHVTEPSVNNAISG